VIAVSDRDQSSDHSCSQHSSRRSPELLTDTTSHSVSMPMTLKPYMKFTNASVAAQVDSMQACRTELCQWLLSNGLAINPGKSEAIVVSTAQRSRRTNTASCIDVAGHSVPISKSLKLLSVTLDEHLTFNEHVNNTNWQARFLRLRGPQLSFRQGQK